MFLVVGFHPELEAVLILDPAHEGEIPGKMTWVMSHVMSRQDTCHVTVPGLGDCGGARAASPAQGAVQTEVLPILVRHHQRSVGVQRLLVVAAMVPVLRWNKSK